MTGRQRTAPGGGRLLLTVAAHRPDSGRQERRGRVPEAVDNAG